MMLPETSPFTNALGATGTRRRIRLGATSCVYPGDIVFNAERLAPLVDDIELVLFDVEGYGCNYPDRAVVSRLNRIAVAHDLTYTVHFELDLRSAREDGGIDASLEKARRIIHCTRELNPWGYVAHLDGRIFLGRPGPAAVRRWRRQAGEAVLKVCEWLDRPGRLCIENIERWDPEAFAPLVASIPVSRCIDVGHLWVQGADPAAHLDAWIHRARIVHLHGLAGEDHRSLSLVPRESLDPVAAILKRRFRGVVTLEVFTEKDLLESLRAWRRALDRV